MPSAAFSIYKGIPSKLAGVKMTYKESCAGNPHKAIQLPPLLPPSPNPANSLQPLKGDPVVTLRAASPCTFKAPGVE